MATIWSIGRPLRVSGRDRARLRLALDLGVHGAEHRLLAGEVVVDRALGDPRAGRDLRRPTSARSPCCRTTRARRRARRGGWPRRAASGGFRPWSLAAARAEYVNGERDAVLVFGYRPLMKVARIAWQGATVHGIVDAEAGTVAPLDATVDLFAALAGAGEPGAPVALDEVRLLAPLEPPSFRDFITFEEHIEGPSLARGGIPETLVRDPHLLLHERRRGHRHGRGHPGAARVRAVRLRVRAGGGDRRARAATSRPGRRTSTSPATRSSTTGRRATSRCTRCGSVSARRRARTAPTRSGRGS